MYYIFMPLPFRFCNPICDMEEAKGSESEYIKDLKRSTLDIIRKMLEAEKENANDRKKKRNDETNTLLNGFLSHKIWKIAGYV